MAIERVFDAETVWVSDIEPGPRKVLAHRFPGVPNLGDITTIDWHTVPPVDIIAGGSPCQDISGAGRMAGMREGTRSNLWVEMREAISILRPRLVIWENVSAARSTAAFSAMESDPGLLGDHPAGVPALRALGRVLGDLASLGYDAQWYSLRAADVGAPHGRLCYFILAADTNDPRCIEYWRAVSVRATLAATQRSSHDLVALLPTPAACNPNDGEGPETWLARRERVKATGINGNGMGMPLGIAVQLLPTWGPYTAAIARWERINGPAPAPTKLGKKGRPKLNPEFAAWMMGCSPGWITDVPDVTDNEALRMAGNGVVRQQAEFALRIMADRFTQWSNQ